MIEKIQRTMLIDLLLLIRQQDRTMAAAFLIDSGACQTHH